MKTSRPVRLLSLSLVLAACGDDAATTEVTDGTTDTSATTNATTSATTSGSTSSPTSGETDTTSATTAGTTTAGTTDTTATTATTDTTSATDTTDATTTAGVTEGTTDTDATTTDTTGATDTSTTGDTDTDTGGADDVTIYEIQDGTIPMDVAVSVKGVIVSAVDDFGIFVQEPPGGEYSGVWVYTSKMGPDITKLAIGDEVDLTGMTFDLNGLTEIEASKGTITPTGKKGLIVTPELLPISTFTDPVTAEPWEGVLVRIEGAPLAVVGTPGFDEFVVSSSGDSVYVDEMVYNVFKSPVDFPNFGIGASFTAIQGPLNFTFNNFKVAPRQKSDLEGYVAGEKMSLALNELKAGELIVTEVMYNPLCDNDDCEWIEVLNLAPLPVNLNGLVIQDNQENVQTQGKVVINLMVPSGGYAWLGKGTVQTWPYVQAADAHTGTKPDLGNSGDYILVRSADVVLDKTATWPNKGAPAAGLSWHLKPDQLDSVANDNASNWCYSTTAFDANMPLERGTPKAPNEVGCAPI